MAGKPSFAVQTPPQATWLWRAMPFQQRVLAVFAADKIAGRERAWRGLGGVVERGGGIPAARSRTPVLEALA
jgi:hypothetical protein